MKKLLTIVGWSLLGIAVVLVFVILAIQNKPKKVTYNIEEVTLSESIQNKTVLTGTLSPRNEILLKPQLSGIIAEIEHEPGDIVKQGDIIARIEVVPDMMESSSAQSRLKISEIDFQKAEKRFLRDKDLYEKGVVSKEEFENSSAAYYSAKETLENSRESLDIVLKGVSSKTVSTSTTLVRSTISGTILDIPVKVGTSVIQANTFNDGTTIASVADMNDIIFVGEADETIVGQLSVGMPVEIFVGALSKERYDAEIEYIAPKGTEKNGATYFEVRVAVKVPEGNSVRAGYSANAQVVLSGVSNVLSIPEGCVSYKEGKATVEFVTKENPLTTETRTIVTGLSDGVRVEVKEGLRKGDKIRGNAR